MTQCKSCVCSFVAQMQVQHCLREVSALELSGRLQEEPQEMCMTLISLSEHVSDKLYGRRRCAGADILRVEIC